jgi:hypothetical protein
MRAREDSLQEESARVRQLSGNLLPRYGNSRSNDISLRETETGAMILGDDRADREIEPAPAPGGRWLETNSRLRRFTHNLRRESILFNFFARNPLKSPDSEK